MIETVILPRRLQIFYMRASTSLKIDTQMPAGQELGDSHRNKATIKGNTLAYKPPNQHNGKIVFKITMKTSRIVMIISPLHL